MHAACKSTIPVYVRLIGDAVKEHGRFLLHSWAGLETQSSSSLFWLHVNQHLSFAWPEPLHTTKIMPLKYNVHSLVSTGQIIFNIPEYWQEPAMIPPGLFAGILFYQQRWRPAWHSCNLSLWSHDSSCYWPTCSNSFRNWKMYTYTFPVIPKAIHLEDTAIFLLACFVSFGFSAFQELVNILLLQVILLVKVPCF